MASDGDMPRLVSSGTQRLQRGDKSACAFIEKDSPLLLCKTGEKRLPVSTTSRRKTIKSETCCGQAGSDERDQSGDRARKGNNGNGMLQSGAHQTLAGIGDARHTRIADERNVLSTQQAIKPCTVPVTCRLPAVTQQAGGNTKMLGKRARNGDIFA